MVLTEEGLMERLRSANAEAVCEQRFSHGSPFSMRLHAGDHASHFEAKQIYFGLLEDGPDDLAVARSRMYLASLLERVEAASCDLPENPRQLQAWSDAHTGQVGAEYRRYLRARKTGGARQYFAHKSHALYFLKAVAPTKLVDGAWLYGLLKYWRDPRFLPLIQTYLEELGEGISDKNHVVIYKRLLAAHGCPQWHRLSDTHFIQGAIQLALAQHTADFLPEVIGYNLGYEQLPLHLLISAYELNELGIDPYYFTLHVTVDNASTGHATHALRAVAEALPHVADKQDFYRRLANGYKLNDLGASTNSVIEDFDLDEELVNVLAAKARVGAQLHSDYCRIAGKTVNEWLSEPGQLPLFLDALQKQGWIKRHQHPEASRFWKLIQGEHAQMFGVFNAYEKQVIYDWIAGESSAEPGSRPVSFRARQRLAADTPPQQDDFDTDPHVVEQELTGATGTDDRMAQLIRLISPVHHHTTPGLMATRAFTRLLHGT